MTDATDASTGGPQGAPSPGARRPTWPIFICYRQDDGKAAARWLAEHLDKRTLSFVPEGYDVEPTLEVYFDETAPAVEDWTKIHQPALERARALLMVCSPAAMIDFGQTDWVQKELRWWMAHRGSAPLLVDSTGAGARYVPDAIKARWPQAQRTKVLPNTWERLSDGDRRPEEQRALERILGGIRASEVTVRHEDLERARARARLLAEQARELEAQSTRLRRQRAGLAVLLVAAVAAAGLAVSRHEPAAQCASRQLARAGRAGRQHPHPRLGAGAAAGAAGRGQRPHG